MNGIILYFVLGVINILIRLWIVIRYKIGCNYGLRWKIFWLTEFILEQILIWPINLIVSTYIYIRGKIDPIWGREIYGEMLDLICEEDDD